MATRSTSTSDAELPSPSLREDFPILSHTVHSGKRLVYLDPGTTSQCPKQVIDAEVGFLTHHNAPIHRGAYEITEKAADVYEDACEAIAGFIGADYDGLAFMKNAAGALNTVVFALGDDRSDQYQVGEGDEIIVIELEHHANLVPWQELARRTGATLRWYGVIEDGRIDVDSLKLNEKIKVMTFTHQSSVTGATTDVKEMVRRAREVGALVVPNVRQLVPHMPVDIRGLDIDFLAFSGHKMLGPNGVGMLHGRQELPEALPSFLTGGSMVEVVTMEETTFAAPPQCFETGTMMTSQVVGLGTAVKYLDTIDMDKAAAHEHRLTTLTLGKLQEIDSVITIDPTTPEQCGSAVSFKVEGIHPHDLDQVLDDQGVCIRIGHHCTWPIRQIFNIQLTARASPYTYNTEENVQAPTDAVRCARKFFGVTP